MITHSVQIDIIGELKSKRARQFPLQSALLELIDNSVDEGASKITIREDDGDLVIEDNGTGFQDIASALVVAKSQKQGKIGRYGVGMKDACLKYSESTIIESNGKRFTAPWVKMMEIKNPNLVQEEDIGHDPITRITLCRFRPQYNRAIETKEIRRTYQKLIEAGNLEITVTGTKLGKLDTPKFTHSIDERFDYEGRIVHVTGGIMKSDDPCRRDWYGYNPYYNGRLIGNGHIMSAGTGSEGCSDFCFMLDLIDANGSWTLATNKDEVEGMNELLDYIYHQYTQPLLKEGAEQTRDIKLKEMEDSINQMLGGENGNITRSPKTPSDKKRKDSKEGTVKRNTNTSTIEGIYNSGGKRTPPHKKIQFKFSHLAGTSIGEVMPQGKSTIIIANLNNPFIAECKDTDNRPMMMFFAKIAHSIYREASKLPTEMFAAEWTSAIMTLAGEELAFTKNNQNQTQ